MVGQNAKQQPRPDRPGGDDDPVDADVLDKYGFLKEPDLWSRDLALGLAAEMNLGELTEAHWRVIDWIRAHHLDSGMLPVQSTLCREVELDPDCIVALFGGPIELWRLAGLPDPGEEARTYMENQEAPEAVGTTQALP